MASFALRPDVHAAAIGDDLVLLDVRSDAYLCLRGGVRPLRPDARLRVLHPSDASAAEMLLAGGFVGAGQSGDDPAPPPPLPTNAVPAGARPRLGLLDAARLSLALLDLPLRYLGRSFESVVQAAQRGRRAPVADAAEALRLARLFEIWAVWLPVPRKCLVRSFLLLRFLQRSGCSAHWVFGVRTWPFGAHCWIQLGDIALDDHPDRLIAYRPILAVRG